MSRRLSTENRRYKSDFDKNVLPETKFQIGDYVFVDLPQLYAIESDAANALGLTDTSRPSGQ